MHICVLNLTIIGSDNGLSPGRRQAITWTNVGIILGTNFSEKLIEIHTLSLKKIHLKMLSGKWWPFCLGLNVLTGAFIQEKFRWISQVLHKFISHEWCLVLISFQVLLVGKYRILNDKLFHPNCVFVSWGGMQIIYSTGIRTVPA